MKKYYLIIFISINILIYKKDLAKNVIWVRNVNEKWYFEKLGNSINWKEFNGEIVINTYVQVQDYFDDDEKLVVIMSRKRDGLVIKLTEGKLFWGNNITNIKQESYSGRWIEKKSKQNKQF